MKKLFSDLVGWLRLPQNKWALSFGLAYTALIADVALIVEDLTLFAGSADQPSGWVWCWRSGVFLLAAIAAGFFYYKSRQHARDNGTLYYLRLLDVSMPDWNWASVERRDRRDFRSASALINYLASPDPRVVDASPAAGKISTSFEMALNDDSDERGTQIAPNLIAPAALAVGYEWLVSNRDIILEELNGDLTKPDFSFSMHQLFEEARNSSIQAGCDAIVGIDPICHHDIWCNEPASDAIKRVWLTFKLSNRVGGSVPEADTECPIRRGCQLVRVVGAAHHDELVPVSVPKGRQSTSINATSIEDGSVETSATKLALVIAGWISATLLEFPDAHVFVSLQAPKAVNLAAGVLLKELRVDWRRVVTVGFFGGANRVMQVRSDQPSPDSIFEGGLEGPFGPYLKSAMRKPDGGRPA